MYWSEDGSLGGGGADDVVEVGVMSDGVKP